MSKPAQKHERLLLKKIQDLHPRIKASIQLRAGRNTHKRLHVELLGVQTFAEVSSSPSCAEHAINMIRQTIMRNLRSAGLDLTKQELAT